MTINIDLAENRKVIRQLLYMLLKSKTFKTKLLNPNENQTKLLNMKPRNLGHALHKTGRYGPGTDVID